MELVAMVGRRVADYRARQNISQQSFAQKCEISSRYLSRVENGSANPSLRVLKNISAQMGISLTDLLRFS